MPADRFLIGFVDSKSGLQTNVRPWLIADNAFSELNNAYVYRGRVRKRLGSDWMTTSQLGTRLRINLGNTGASPHTATLPNIANLLAVGQMFSINDDIFTVNAVGGAAVPLLTTNPAVTATLDDTVTPNTVTFTGAAVGVPVFFYPSLPVMGLDMFESQQVNDEPTFAFDTKFAYAFDDGTNGWLRLSGGTDIWTGSDSDFFWTVNYFGLNAFNTVFFATNNTESDQIRFWVPTNPAIPLVGTWSLLTSSASLAQYNANANEIIVTCRIILPFKNRLLFLNTVEKNAAGTNNRFINRCRFSQNGSPLATNAWREDIAGKGGAIDAPIAEEIITAQFLRDRLIVFFEKSTWEIVYTGNEVRPFVWQKINTELGAESTFSQIPFDKSVIGVGNVGIQACNGVNVARIDEKIPDTVFNIQNVESGTKRVVGIRDYYNELSYWTYPENGEANLKFPNKLLIYNYLNETWAKFDDSITFLNYYQTSDSTPSITWGVADMTWAENDDVWNSGATNAKTLKVLAGNQQGYCFIMRRGRPINAPVLQVTNITTSGSIATITCINHNLYDGDWVYFSNIVSTGNIATTLNDPETNFQITRVNADTFTVSTFPFITLSGTYEGGGVIGRVSRIQIKSKDYNFYAEKDRNAYISQVNFLVDRTSTGEIQVNFYTSTSIADIVEDGILNNSLIGDSVLETRPYSVNLAPLEQTQTQLWHPIYLQAEGQFVSLELIFTNIQMANPDITNVDFQLHGMVFHAQPTSNRLQ